MSKETKTYVEFKNPGDGELYAISNKGSVHLMNNGKLAEQAALTAAELDRIFAGATYFKAMKAPKLLTLTSEYEIVYYKDDDTYDAGDIWVGCVHVPYKTLEQAHRLSLKLRRRKA